ncbi:hypothetical protein MJO29_005779, partial [Puccinia striiformis f. sp. tritici]
PQAFETLIAHFCSHITTTILPKLKAEGKSLDVIGFLDLQGPIITLRLGCAFIPVCTAGKLVSQDTTEIQTNAIKPNQNVIVIDDLIATGVRAKAAGELVKILDGNVLEYLFIIEINFLEGSRLLNAPTYLIIHY